MTNFTSYDVLMSYVTHMSIQLFTQSLWLYTDDDLYQLWILNELRNTYVYQTTYTKFLALARYLILLFLSNFWKKLNVDIFFLRCWLKIQYVQLAFENSFGKFTFKGISDLLLKFLTLINSQLSGLQMTRTHNKGINLLTFFKRAQRGYSFECVIYKFTNRTSM